jgi:hypothetical protein
MLAFRTIDTWTEIQLAAGDFQSYPAARGLPADALNGGDLDVKRGRGEQMRELESQLEPHRVPHGAASPEIEALRNRYRPHCWRRSPRRWPH